MTDTVRLKARATFAESDTATRLFGTSVITGWETTVPYNPLTDSPVNPALNYQDPAIVAQVSANPAAFANPGFIATGAAGAQHPVPTQLAILLNSRNPSTYCQRGSTIPGGAPNLGGYAAWGSAGLPCGTWGSNTTATDNPALYGANGMGTAGSGAAGSLAATVESQLQPSAAPDA